MKRFFNNEGEISSDPALNKAEKLVHKAFEEFVNAGYLPRDFFQFADLESSLCIYDWQIEKALGEQT